MFLGSISKDFFPQVFFFSYTERVTSWTMTLSENSFLYFIVTLQTLDRSFNEHSQQYIYYIYIYISWSLNIIEGDWSRSTMMCSNNQIGRLHYKRDLKLPLWTIFNDNIIQPSHIYEKNNLPNQVHLSLSLQLHSIHKYNNNNKSLLGYSFYSTHFHRQFHNHYTHRHHPHQFIPERKTRKSKDKQMGSYINHKAFKPTM